MTTQRKDPTIRVLTIGTILICIGSLVYYLYNLHVSRPKVTLTENTVPVYMDYGTVEGMEYCNDFFAFRLSVPKGHNATYKRYDYLKTGFQITDSVNAVPQKASTIEDLTLVIIEPKLEKIDFMKSFKETNSIAEWNAYHSERSKRERFGADYQLSIRVHNLAGASAAAYEEQFQNLHHPGYRSPTIKEISGVSFREYHGMESFGGPEQQTMFILMGGKNKNIITYFTEINGFSLSIDMFYYTEAQKALLQNMLDELHFFHFLN
ncbi:hypothetical protein [Maribacter sp. 2-571]|uniref:hypothetical protein n=1 Tax=Maribacter sp. 2-571 TaxID=3417569 RepID=UPI003D326C13